MIDLWRPIKGVSAMSTPFISGPPMYSVLTTARDVDGLEALFHFFSSEEDLPNISNFVLFSTNGVHGSYTTIEECETELSEGYAPRLTFLIVQPRIVVLRYGTCQPKTAEDFTRLKALRAASLKVLATVGMPF